MNIKGSKQKKHREYTKRLYQHENGHSGHSSGYKYRRIHYLGRTRPLVTDNALSYYVVKRFKQSGRDSLWLDTYQTEVASTGTHTGNQLVISNIKSIKGENNEEIGMLILNVKESYIYSLISE